MSVQFTDIIRKFEAKGEKTGWSYITIAPDLAQQLKPGNKRSFRVKGTLDDMVINQVAVLPMGDGDFILPINSAMRKQLKKGEGATLNIIIEEDKSEKQLDTDLVDCLQAEPDCANYFYGMNISHQFYFSNWIASAKTEPTKAKRLAHTLEAMQNGWNYSEMMHVLKTRK